MELFPSLEITCRGSWLIFIWLPITNLIILTTVPKEVRSRLLDRSKFTKSQRILTTIGKFFSLVTIVLIVLTPLAIGSIELIAGIILFSLGMIGEVIAVYNFKKTPLGEPVTQGFYKISRNPQEAMLTLAVLGACLAIGSISAILILLISRKLNHFQILAQEQACLQDYGQAYQDYMDKIPRYFLFF